MKRIVRIIITFINILLFIVFIYFTKNIFKYYFFNEALVKVPNVVNLDENEAKKVLENVSLNYNLINSRSIEVPFNVVYKQTPRANEMVKINRAIKLYVNNEKGDRIPDLRDLPIAKAMKILKEKNIEITRIDYVQTDTDEDTVIASYPKENSLIRYGEKISLLVTTRKLTLTNKMPNIVGYDVSEGRKLLRDLDYNNIEILGIIDSNFPENMVVKTLPMPNTEITKETKIKIYVSIPKEELKDIVKPEETKNIIDEIIKKALEEKNEGN